MKRVMLTICLILLLTSGCTSPTLTGSVALKTVFVSGTISTAGLIAFDKQLYKALKNQDWFMIDSEQYMPESYRKESVK